MSTDILFWYTGWAVWAVVGLSLFCALIYGIIGGMIAVKEWAACLVIARMVGDTNGRRKLNKLIYHIGAPPGVDFNSKAWKRWWPSFIRATYIHGINTKANP